MWLGLRSWLLEILRNFPHRRSDFGFLRRLPLFWTREDEKEKDEDGKDIRAVYRRNEWKDGRSVVATNGNVNDKDGRMEGSDGRKK